MPCEVYSRIVGYLRPVQNWNDGKKQEFADRKPFPVTPPVAPAVAEVPRA
jgi:hypothetical protein